MEAAPQHPARAEPGEAMKGLKTRPDDLEQHRNAGNDRDKHKYSK